LSFSQPQCTFLAAVGELAPEVVDLGLAIARDLERDRLVELELRAAIEADELLAFDFELDGHDGSRRLAVDLLSFLSVAANLDDLEFLKIET
jgi:hypothetical protein